MYLAFIDKMISGTIIFLLFIEKARPGHDCPSESFINEGRLVTPNMFFLYWSMNIRYFRVKCWRDNSWNVVNNALLKWLKFLYYMILGLRFEWETFKTVNINLWKSDKLDFKKIDEWKRFGWFVKMWSKCWIFSILKVGCFIRFLKLYDAQNCST